MSKPSPYTMTIGEDGLSVRCEWDAHYLTDEQLETVRKHVETLQAENAKLLEQLEGIVGRSFRTADKMERLEAENAKLRELVCDMWNDGMCECGSRGKCARCEYGYPDRMRELGVEVDA